MKARRWSVVLFDQLWKDELLMLVATYCPHTAFIDPLSAPDSSERESIELRALVFYDD